MHDRVKPDTTDVSPKKRRAAGHSDAELNRFIRELDELMQRYDISDKQLAKIIAARIEHIERERYPEFHPNAFRVKVDDYLYCAGVKNDAQLAQLIDEERSEISKWLCGHRFAQDKGRVLFYKVIRLLIWKSIITRKKQIDDLLALARDATPGVVNVPSGKKKEKLLDVYRESDWENSLDKAMMLDWLIPLQQWPVQTVGTSHIVIRDVSNLPPLPEIPPPVTKERILIAPTRLVPKAPPRIANLIPPPRPASYESLHKL